MTGDERRALAEAIDLETRRQNLPKIRAQVEHDGELLKGEFPMPQAPHVARPAMDRYSKLCKNAPNGCTNLVLAHVRGSAVYCPSCREEIYKVVDGKFQRRDKKKPVATEIQRVEHNTDVEKVHHHPGHYGGDTTYETIKVIEAWGLGFHLGNAVKYISRAGKKNPAELVTDLEKARFYLDRAIEIAEGKVPDATVGL